MRVSVEMLREVFDILMRHLVETGNEEIDLEYDYYWDIPWNELNNVEVIPKDLDMGQYRSVSSTSIGLSYTLTMQLHMSWYLSLQYFGGSAIRSVDKKREREVFPANPMSLGTSSFVQTVYKAGVAAYGSVATCVQARTATIK